LNPSWPFPFIGPKTNIASHNALVVLVARSLSGWPRRPLYFRDKFLKDVKGNTVVFHQPLCCCVRTLVHSSQQPLLRRVIVHPFLAVLSTPQAVCPLLFAPRRHFNHRSPSRLFSIGPLNGICRHESLTLLCSSRYYCPFPRFSSDTMDRVSS
jgi:hypothetical protein